MLFIALLTAGSSELLIADCRSDCIFGGGSRQTDDPLHAIRSGNPGQLTSAGPARLLHPGATITGLRFLYRYNSGYGPLGIGTHFVVRIAGVAVYSSPQFLDYCFDNNRSNFSLPVPVVVNGVSIVVPADGARISLEFDNQDRNVQILLPINMTVACSGEGPCLAPQLRAPAEIFDYACRPNTGFLAGCMSGVSCPVSGTESISACQQLCSDQPRCQALVYNTDRLCYLKPQIGGIGYDDVGTTSCSKLVVAPSPPPWPSALEASTLHPDLQGINRVIVTTPAGRQGNMAPLIHGMTRYRAAGLVDEWHLWDNCFRHDDRVFLHRTAWQLNQPGAHNRNGHAWVRVVPQPDGVVPAWALNTNRLAGLGAWWADATYQAEAIHSDALVVRFDDDVVWLDDPEHFRRFLAYTRHHLQYPFVFANILNNDISTMMNQRHGRFADLTPRTRCCDDGVLDRGDLAAALHREVLESGPASFRVDAVEEYAHRVSINAMAWYGPNLAELWNALQHRSVDRSLRFSQDGRRSQFNAPWGHRVAWEEEPYVSEVLSEAFGRSNAWYGDFVVAHFSFGPQSAYLHSRTDLLQRYLELDNRPTFDTPIISPPADWSVAPPPASAPLPSSLQRPSASASPSPPTTWYTGGGADTYMAAAPPTAPLHAQTLLALREAIGAANVAEARLLLTNFGIPLPEGGSLSFAPPSACPCPLPTDLLSTGAAHQNPSPSPALAATHAASSVECCAVEEQRKNVLCQWALKLGVPMLLALVGVWIVRAFLCATAPRIKEHKEPVEEGSSCRAGVASSRAQTIELRGAHEPAVDPAPPEDDEHSSLITSSSTRSSTRASSARASGASALSGHWVMRMGQPMHASGNHMGASPAPALDPAFRRAPSANVAEEATEDCTPHCGDRRMWRSELDTELSFI